MTLYLVRHAHAGSRTSDKRDVYRQLSEKGHRRAEMLAEILADAEITHVVSSPATRCVQTVEPLAAALGLEIVEDDALWEDADTDDVMTLVETYRKRNAVFSSHGNLIPLIVEQLADRGAKVKGRGCEKGSIWKIESKGKKFTKATYISRTVEMILS